MVTYVVAGKILRSTVIKLEVAEIEISLFMENNIMHTENIKDIYIS